MKGREGKGNDEGLAWQDESEASWHQSFTPVRHSINLDPHGLHLHLTAVVFMEMYICSPRSVFNLGMCSNSARRHLHKTSYCSGYGKIIQKTVVWCLILFIHLSREFGDNLYFNLYFRCILEYDTYNKKLPSFFFTASFHYYHCLPSTASLDDFSQQPPARYHLYLIFPLVPTSSFTSLPSFFFLLHIHSRLLTRPLLHPIPYPTISTSSPLLTHSVPPATHHRYTGRRRRRVRDTRERERVNRGQ